MYNFVNVITQTFTSGQTLGAIIDLKKGYEHIIVGIPTMPAWTGALFIQLGGQADGSDFQNMGRYEPSPFAIWSINSTNSGGRYLQLAVQGNRYMRIRNSNPPANITLVYKVLCADNGKIKY